MNHRHKNASHTLFPPKIFKNACTLHGKSCNLLRGNGFRPVLQKVFSSFILHPSSFYFPKPASNLADSRRRAASDASRRPLGFTLIELLVTLAIFTAVMTVLVEGLHSGIRAWRSIRSHQIRHAQVQVLAQKLAEDFRHVAVVDNQPAIVESTIETGGEKIAITTTVPRKRQRAGLGWVWNHVEWSTAVDSDGTQVLLRTVQPHAGTAAVGNKPIEETLLKNIKSARFDYVGDEGPSPTWNAQQGLPSAVLITVQPETGPELVIPAWVPGGTLLRRDIGG